ncbi:hypothetical protein ACUOA8_63395, partial [Escherichia sp. SS-MK2]
ESTHRLLDSLEDIVAVLGESRYVVLVRTCREAGICVVPLPGPCAAPLQWLLAHHGGLLIWQVKSLRN